jgi:subtilisin family serine protease
MYKSILVILATIFAIIFAASTGQGQHGALVGLSPDESINPLPEDRFTAQPAKCRNVGKDCVAGEFLAIFKNGNNIPVDLGNEVKVFLNSPDLSGSPVTFTAVETYQLATPAMSSPAPYDVCGGILLRIKFTPVDKVNEAMQFVSEKLPPGGPGGPLVSRSTILGIQPLGGTRPNPSAAPESKPTASVPDATMMIGAQASVIRNNQLLPPVIVAVLDTGWNNVPGTITVASNLAWGISDLDSRPFPPPKGLTTGLVDDDLIGPNGIGHGTPIASIIGSKDESIGAAPNAQIVPIKICDKDGACNEASAIIGTCYALSVNASVINMSFAGRTPLPDAAGEIHMPIFEGLINDAARAGALVVAAAGNSRDDTFIAAHPNETVDNEAFYPAIISSGPADKELGATPPKLGAGMLSVGAIFTNLKYAAFATYNNRVDLAAPGSWVRVMGKDGKIKSTSNGVNVSGTSFAAAYVSGAAALLIGHNAVLQTPDRDFTAVKLAKLITDKNVINTTDSGCLRTIAGSSECGAGTLDVFKAWKKQGL